MHCWPTALLAVVVLGPRGLHLDVALGRPLVEVEAVCTNVCELALLDVVSGHWSVLSSSVGSRSSAVGAPRHSKDAPE